MILHHICGTGMMLGNWASGLPGPALQFIRRGDLAVQTFFILSGFVLARTYAHSRWNRRSLARFFTARFARIYPVYLASLIVLSPFIIETLLKPVWKTPQRIGLLAIYLFVFQGWAGTLGVGWNTPAWSLTCEFFFYLCFPMLLVMLRNARWRTICALLLLSLPMRTALDHAGVPWDWKPVYHLADFVAGIAAARAFTLLEISRWWRNRGYWLYVPAIFLGGWLIIHPALVDGNVDLDSYLGPLNVAMLVGLALGGGWLARWLSTGPADFLGKASYSMYVMHVPILWWYARYYVHGRLLPPRPLAGAIYLALLIGASGVVFKWIETPASAWIRGRQKRATALPFSTSPSHEPSRRLASSVPPAIRA